MDDANGASNANEPRNVPRAAGADVTYVRRHNRDDDTSSSRMQDESKFWLHNESYSDLDIKMDEESVPIDDEEIGDFGEPFKAQESDRHKGVQVFSGMIWCLRILFDLP